jgi:hypothetical protein
VDFDPYGHRSKVTSDYQKEFDFRPIPHPPFSPDAALPDFDFVGAIKQKRTGFEFGNTEEHGSDVTDIRNFIPPIALTVVFPEWGQRLQKCTDREIDDIGEDVHQNILSVAPFLLDMPILKIFVNLRQTPHHSQATT